MPAPSHAPFAGPLEMVTTARIARLFYTEGWSKVQIAEELGLTRFRVARLLELARASGMVRITVAAAGSLDLVLSERLCQEFGLRHAVVVNTTTGGDQEIRSQVGTAAAELLSEIMTPNDVLGVGWARVVLAMAAMLRGLRARRVVQLTGALTRPDVEAVSVDVVRTIAREAKADACVFYAPMIVSDEHTARGLYRQAAVAEAVTHFDTVTKAVVGVGGWNPPGSTLYDALTPRERTLARKAGVEADLSGVLLDSSGDALDTELTRRIIAVSAPQLRNIPEVIGVAYGLTKVAAAYAGIRGGYLNALVTHADFARRLLNTGD